MNSTLRWLTAYNASIVDDQMREYIDFTSGIFAANIGHNNPAVLDAVTGALQHFGPHCYTYGLALRDRYVERLKEWTGFEAVHLFTTGSEAVEAAMRIASLMGFGPDDFFALPGTFHGKTWGPREIAVRTDFWDFYEADCLLMEGYRGWDANFWTDDQIDSVKQAGVLIVDEVQSGFGRTGKRFAYKHYDDLHPDMMVIGKGMGNGFPVSAICCNGKAAETLESWRDEFSSTHGGNPVACAAGLAVLDYFEKEGVMRQAEEKGHILHEWLEVVCPLVHQGMGMVAAVLAETTEQATMIVERCRDRGLLLVHTNKASVKLGPPLTIPVEQLVRGVKLLGEVIREVT